METIEKIVASRRQVLFKSSALVALGLAGCAGVPPTHKFARPLPLTYANSALRSQLESVDLLRPFTDYWTAYAKRDWVGRYQMERFSVDILSNFYEVYHAAAWIIEAFVVEAVSQPDEKGRVRIDVQAKFSNPNRPDEVRNGLVQDWWLGAAGAAWRHINTDPMLNGLKSPL